MSRKRKSGLQSGLSEIIARQTAPVEAKQSSSASLLDKFSEAEKPADRLLKIGLPKTSRLLESDILGYSNPPLLKTSSPPQNEQPKNLMAALPDVEGYTKLWHQMTDHLYRKLTSSEQAVHIQLFRLSWGHNTPNCVVGLPNLSKRTGIAKTTVQRAIDGLIKKGLIEKVRVVFGRETVQGVEYRIIPPPALLKTSSLLKTSRLLKTSTIKERNTLKEKEIKRAGARARLSDSEISERAQMISELIEKGNYTLEQAEKQFAESFGDDWAEIKEIVVGQQSNA